MPPYAVPYSSLRSPRLLLALWRSCLGSLLELALWLLLVQACQAQGAPRLSQASDYSGGVDLADYWVSEKLDGVRGYWDGTTLRFRSGSPINAPDWFIAALPDTAIDGELWLGRQRFDEVSGLLRQTRAPEAAWRELKFMAFDLPHSQLDFDARLAALRELVAKAETSWLQLIPQFRVADHRALQQALERVVAQGGEGLILHRGASFYHDRQNADLMKLKAVQEGEALVIGHLPGQGRLRGMLGALLVELPDGRRFRLGTGFSDAQRRQPPAQGSHVRYRHNGLTSSGLPRFARFVESLED